jgi:hypothetical protein
LALAEPQSSAKKYEFHVRKRRGIGVRQ